MANNTTHILGAIAEVRKRSERYIHTTAGIIHEALGLQFCQCVQALKSKDLDNVTAHMYNMAERNFKRGHVVSNVWEDNMPTRDKYHDLVVAKCEWAL